MRPFFGLRQAMYSLVLASQSPRRRQLLEEAGYAFTVHPLSVSEKLNENMNLHDALLSLSRDKVQSFVTANKSMKGQMILALSADTVVVHENQVLGKPRDAAQAKQFLQQLSGKTHSVMTAFCVYNFNTSTDVAAIEETKVRFKNLSDDEIDQYILTGEPFDKAGAYGIQGLAGKFVLETSGSWSNVVGLPMERLQKVLHECGWNVVRRAT